MSPMFLCVEKKEFMNGHYDFIIIGTGAGGGTLVHKLAASGKKILVLERGDFVKRDLDNCAMWFSIRLNDLKPLFRYLDFHSLSLIHEMPISCFLR